MSSPRFREQELERVLDLAVDALRERLTGTEAAVLEALGERPIPFSALVLRAGYSERSVKRALRPAGILRQFFGVELDRGRGWRVSSRCHFRRRSSPVDFGGPKEHLP